MSTVFESVAAARPRIRRDVLFTAAYDGVLFHNASGGFKITSPSAYKLASLLVPFLDGRRTVAELCAKLPGPQRAMVGELVSALISREFARDVPPDEADPADVLGADVAKRFASQIGYIDHYADRAPQRFAAYRDSTAVVVGSGPVAHTCALSLVRNGMARVAVVGHSDGAAAAEAARSGVPSTVEERAAVTWDDTDIVLIAGGEDAARLTHRLLADGIPAGKTVIPAWTFGGRAVIGPANGADRHGCWYCAMLRLTANDGTGAAAEIWRRVAVPSPSLSEGVTGPVAAMIGNLLAFEVFRLTTGALPAETDGAVIVQDLESLDVVSERLATHPRCVYCPPQPVAVSAPDGLVQAHTGVFRGYDDEHWDQSPVKIATLVFTDPTGTARRVSAFDVHDLVGARARVLAHAAVAYADRLTAGPATSLGDGRPVEVPRAALEPFGAANSGRTVEPGRAGAGAGVDRDSAVHDALGSALAYSALQAAIAGATVCRIPLSSLGDDPELHFLTRAAANLGFTVDLLDLGPAPGGAHALLARCGETALWTVAADPSWREAAVRALCDLVGQLQLRQQAGATDGRDPFLADFDPDTLVAAGDAPPRLDATGTWPDVIDALGTDVVVAPIGGSDLPAHGLHAVRVVLQAQA